MIKYVDGVEYASLPNSTVAMITGVNPAELPEHLVLPEKVDKYRITVIGRRVFANCDDLISVTFPKTMLIVLEGAFANCKNLTTVKFCTPHKFYETMLCIGTSAFENCVSLSDVKMPRSNTEISSFAFKNCVKLEDITFPSSDLYFKYDSFAGCINLKIISINREIREFNFLNVPCRATVRFF